MSLFKAIIVFASMCVPVSAGAADLTPTPPQDILRLTTCGKGTVADHQSADSLILNGGQTVQLALIKPLQTKHTFTPLARGTSLTLKCSGRRKNRFGALIAHAVTDKDEWVNGQLVAAGGAIVFSMEKSTVGLTQLRALEASARQNKRGIWRRGNIINPAGPDLYANAQLVIVEGTIKNAARARGSIYLNFGNDWNKDFTAEIKRNHVKAFDNAGIQLLTLEGARVEVRGYLTWKGGPHVELTSPVQLQVMQ